MARIDDSPQWMTIAFRPDPPVDAPKIVALVQQNKHIKLAGNDKLKIERALPDVKHRVQMLRDVLRQLGPPVAQDRAAV